MALAWHPKTWLFISWDRKDPGNTHSKCKLIVQWRRACKARGRLPCARTWIQPRRQKWAGMRGGHEGCEHSMINKSSRILLRELRVDRYGSQLTQVLYAAHSGMPWFCKYFCNCAVCWDSTRRTEGKGLYLLGGGVNSYDPKANVKMKTCPN